MQRTTITSQPPANLPELLAAAARLRSQGCIVTESGDVLHPSREAALASQLTEEVIADAMLLAAMDQCWAVIP